jgi:hypothetical protein
MLLDEVAKLLVDASAIEVTTDRDSSVEVWTISASGAVIRASAPRLEIADQMQLSTRLRVEGVAHVVTLVIEKADVQSETRAALTLRVVSAQADSFQRQSERYTLAAPATLTALVCGRVVPGQQVSASVADLSETGAGIKTTDARPRPPDLMHLYCRFLEGAIDCDIRITRATNEPGGTFKLGCTFTDPPPATIELVRRVLDRVTGTHRVLRD